ncbi:hypothetical protein QBC32DRAFT_368675 [Pseudoneurospora amorphoporcata]|uniref:Uncharacterized protein n=1 Tax=Pseudoneurospora amorphoporcata TaxID=241081 RepID=A0AAN6SHB7_9PEZI|nr:hypothetical protein QBC32DRAFT_368675 [Pseudoneurospora amorphoporcata]
MGPSLLQFASWVSPRPRPPDQKSRALAGPGEPGWHLALASQILPVPSPQVGWLPAQKSQSVPVTKLPLPPPFSPSRFPFHRPFPRPPSHHRRPKTPRRRRRRPCPSSVCCTLRLDCILTHTRTD